ncbi:MAG: hypothetical protein GXO99_04310, partial [Nitrospirae bacterium]|nr:hypothetical protein [Nitrospirota bacterium]
MKYLSFKKISFLISVALFLLCITSIPAFAYVITFDDIQLNRSGIASVDSKYIPFKFVNFFAIDPDITDAYDTARPTEYYDGYRNAIISGCCVAYNGLGNDASIKTLRIYYYPYSRNYNITQILFNWNGAYFTAAHRDNLNIKITAGYVDRYNRFVRKYSETITVSTDRPFWFSADWKWISWIYFSSYGGVYANGEGTQFAIDNFTYNEPFPYTPPELQRQSTSSGGTGVNPVPEPSSILLFGS